MKKVQIIFSSIGGNTALVVEKVSEILGLQEILVSINRVENTNFETLFENDLVILASPTYGQGNIEEHFIPFSKKLSKLDCSNQKFALIGLGATRFYPEYLTESGAILEEFVTKIKGIQIGNTLRISGDPLKVLDKLVPSWCNKIVNALNI
jgi:flavodoxin I